MNLTIAESPEGFTPWFDVKDGELPSRLGVYEGSAHGVPGFHENAFHHLFYRWDGQRFSGAGSTTAEAALSSTIIFPVAHWRGLLKVSQRTRNPRLTAPNAGAPAIEARPCVDVLVEHLAIDGQVARFRFATNGRELCTMEGEARRNPMGWYISSRLGAAGARSSESAHGAVVFAVEQNGLRRFLYGVWKQADEEDRTFSSVLGEAA